MVEPSVDGAEELVGALIGQKFEVTGFLDRGSIGAVYRAIQRPIGREVVLKVLRPALTSVAQTDPSFAERFRREAETYGRLQHPNTVTLFDYGEDELRGRPIYYMALEYVRGSTLRAVLRREGRLGCERTLRIAIQICRSLREAHGFGIVHRDLKPGNVMVVDGEQEEVVKVLDFGIAKVRMPESEDQEGITRVGVLLGSRLHGARADPQRRGRRAHRHLRARLRPVPDARGHAAVPRRQPHRHLHPAPQRAGADPRPGCRRVARGAVVGGGADPAGASKRPEDRFQTVDDLLYALHGLTDGGTSSMHLVRTHTPAPPRRRAALWVSVGLLIAGVPALILGSCSSWRWSRG
ncbi:MAG: serine/threonine-protein kinase [Myxococcota bacterium]